MKTIQLYMFVVTGEGSVWDQPYFKRMRKVEDIAEDGTHYEWMPYQGVIDKLGNQVCLKL